MCTIGGIAKGGRTFLLKNFDYPAVPTGWAHFTSFNGGYGHFALVDHGQQGLNSGLNEAGLGLQISRSRSLEPSSPEARELRTVLNAEVLSQFSKVEPAMEYIDRYVVDHPDMYGGNVMLADSDHISVTEYLAGRSKSEILKDGILARANHSVFGLTNNVNPGSESRLQKMENFLKDLYPAVHKLGTEDVINRCRSILREPPIFHEGTRSSFVIHIQDRRVDYMVGEGPWHKFSFGDPNP